MCFGKVFRPASGVARSFQARSFHVRGIKGPSGDCPSTETHRAPQIERVQQARSVSISCGETNHIKSLVLITARDYRTTLVVLCVPFRPLGAGNRGNGGSFAGRLLFTKVSLDGL